MVDDPNRAQELRQMRESDYGSRLGALAERMLDKGFSQEDVELVKTVSDYLLKLEPRS